MLPQRRGRFRFYKVELPRNEHSDGGTMKGGANRKSVAQHVRDGTFRPERHAGAAAAVGGPPKKPPTKPKTLVGEGARLWRAVCESLAGVIGPADGAALLQLCLAHDEVLRRDEPARARERRARPTCARAGVGDGDVRPARGSVRRHAVGSRATARGANSIDRGRYRASEGAHEILQCVTRGARRDAQARGVGDRGDTHPPPNETRRSWPAVLGRCRTREPRGVRTDGYAVGPVAPVRGRLLLGLRHSRFRWILNTSIVTGC